MNALKVREAGAGPARPQGPADLERLIATIRAIKDADPTKAPECEPLLKWLKAHLRPAA